MRTRKFGEVFGQLFKVHAVGGMVITSMIFLNRAKLPQSVISVLAGTRC